MLAVNDQSRNQGNLHRLLDRDIIEQRGRLKTLLSDAATDSWPLREKIARYVDEDVMAAIAAEYAKGRVLDIVTTNLDAARPVAWNIGRIAASGSPDALQLIRDVMLASASIPAAFPPVMFDVEAEGKRYDELHVDGGATSILYLYPIGLDWGKLTKQLDVKGKPNVYVLRNGRWRKNWKSVDRSTIPIALRTIDSLMGSAVLGDAYRIYLATQRDGINYNLASRNHFTPSTTCHGKQASIWRRFKAFMSRILPEGQP